MKKRIFRSLCGVALLGVVLASLCVTGVLYRFAFDNMKTAIRDEAAYVVASLNEGDTSGLAATRATFTRITLVDPDGTVVFDSEEDPAGMANHGDRPEIAAALLSGAAEDQRISDTLATQSYYRAVRLQNGQVVRISGAMDSVYVSMVRYLPFLLLACVAAVLISAVAARYLTRRITAPLADVDLENPLSYEPYEELSPLLRRMEQQRVRIREQLEDLTRQREEFQTITANMREGLILLGREATVLSINASAMAALDLTEEDCLGRHILTASRDEVFQSAVAGALAGEDAEAVLAQHGRHYRIFASPVRAGGEQSGVVLLLMDITDRQQAEQLRREFTANVSHELKTPLTSISGFAEIMKNGMVKPADSHQFAQRIYDEAQRLIALVEDIIRLSRLDEGSQEMAREPVDLLALARDVADRLHPLSKAAGVTVSVSGAPAQVEGVRPILDELLQNLCDNAIKYNRPGGRVTISVEPGAREHLLRVSDTGIGIPRESRDRVFERFYRVDKSHSKDTGGTGLGLSIVKHGASLHGAHINLESEEGAGTVVTVRFPVHR